MMVITLSFLLWHSASAFVSPHHQLSAPTTKRKYTRTNYDVKKCGPLCAHAGSGNPLIVVGNTNEALAAAMALCARDQLSNSRSQNNLEERRSPVPPSQLIAFFNKQSESDQESSDQRQQQRLSSETLSSLQNALLFLGPSMDDYEKILADALQLLSRISNNDGSRFGDPMLHTSIDFGSEDGSNTMQSLSITRNRFSFLGLNLNTDSLPSPGDGEFLWSRENADEWGNKLQTLLSDGSQSPAAVTMDVRTHLAMLQANSLPKSRGVLGEKDIWAITDTIQGGMHLDNGDGLAFEYQYDYSDPFGGCDPLLRPSTGYVIPSPISSLFSSGAERKASNDAYAAAYSAMVGSGVNPISSTCIATSVKAIFRGFGTVDDNGMFCPPSYTWRVIDKIVECSIKAGKNMKQEDGLSRKMYKQCGYK